MENGFRWATAEDLEQLSALYEELYRYHININPEKYAVPREGHFERRYGFFLELNPECILVHESDSVFDAYAFLVDSSIVGMSKNRVVLDSLVVTESARRRGIGTAMINEILKYAREKGFDFISLEVEGNNSSAIEFYQKAGFAQQSIKINMELKL